MNQDNNGSVISDVEIHQAESAFNSDTLVQAVDKLVNDNKDELNNMAISGFEEKGAGILLIDIKEESFKYVTLSEVDNTVFQATLLHMMQNTPVAPDLSEYDYYQNLHQYNVIPTYFYYVVKTDDTFHTFKYPTGQIDNIMYMQNLINQTRAQF